MHIRWPRAHRSAGHALTMHIRGSRSHDAHPLALPSQIRWPRAHRSASAGLALTDPLALPSEKNTAGPALTLSIAGPALTNARRWPCAHKCPPVALRSQMPAGGPALTNALCSREQFRSAQS
ncbi:hypothetical protein NDU88_004726 [Pleurodeles waltl]|uniref:Uncharacterized protein n=1 Tax=Pleurodeles waltl TaxID=8319 RepID=A0AAV7LQ81_PLEWA|nr:hypothetical protein NDU88_004726 [Pleurodeles waltl]